MRLQRGRVGGAALLLLAMCSLGVLRDAIAPGTVHAREREGDSPAARDCESCHLQALSGGHPVNIRPRTAFVPTGWPLDAGGRITCATCHARCGHDDTPRGSVETVLGLRGGSSGLEFCARCHEGMGAAGRAAASTNVPARGKILISMGSPAGLRGPAEKHAWAFAVAHPSAIHERGGATDGATLQCLGCHDGTVGASGDLSTERAPGIGDRPSSHPIGTPYPPRPKRNSDNGYVPLGSLDPRIHLPGGKVGCLSCHDMYNNEQKLLVMSNFESKLCYACHDL